MVSSAALLALAQALFFQCISSQYVGAPCNGANALARDAAYSLAYNGAYGAGAPYAAAGYSPAALSASNGGGLAITSSSPIAPTGVTMTSDNAYEGAIAVSGALPYLGAVALEGALPTGGAGAVTYGCGNGNVAITNEDIRGSYGPGAIVEQSLGFAAPLGYDAAASYGSYGYRGCGCGAVY